MLLEDSPLLRTLRREYVPHAPVWLMRQAGRILPAYKALRQTHKDFKTLLKTPELAAAITRQPVDSLRVDAAIIFSDILVVPEAMGMTYHMSPQKGPYFPKPLQYPKDVDKLLLSPPEETLDYVLEAIKIARKDLDPAIPLIGFAGAPWTLLAYMIEGQGSKTCAKARRFLYACPQAAHKALERITTVTTAYLLAQAHAGASVLQLFDTLAEHLPPQQYAIFGIPYLQKILQQLQQLRNIPTILFAKGAYHSLPTLAQLPCQALSLDHHSPIPQTLPILQTAKKVLQGNTDPALLYAPDHEIKQQTHEHLRQIGSYPHIANLGHGLYPDTNYKKVQYWIQLIKEYPKPAP